MSEFFIQTTWWIPVYGLIGAILTLPWSMGIIRRTGPRPAAYLNLLMTILAYGHGLIVFGAIWTQPERHVLVRWLTAADLDVSFALEISSISVGALELVSGLSLLAQLFALGYMEKDWAIARFFALMGFFEAAMSGLVLSDSLLLSYILLEMLTLSTYLLVGFWYAQPLVITAARDAFLTKRVGDVLLLMGLVALATLAGSTNFPALYRWAETAELSPVTATLLGLALIAGSIGKCAQFPLHLWLDEAMEGPNPASVLRNSLVVACGAYVLIKLQPVLTISPVAMAALVAIGTVTAVGASLVAIAQIDIKRALSHSTSAYLGLVFIAVGMQWTDFALLAIFTHAIAKALLFMSIGCVITTTNSQDLTEMGGLRSRLPFTSNAFAIGAAGLVGLFPLGGFWALQQGIDEFGFDGAYWLAGVLLLVNALTAFNLTRVYRLVFLGQPRLKTRRAAEVGWQMILPMMILNVTTISVPFMLNSLTLLPEWTNLDRTAVIPLVISGLVGSGLGAIAPLNRSWARPLQKPARFVQDLLAYDFYIDRLYSLTVVSGVNLVSRWTSWFDHYIVDGAVNLVGLGSLFSGESLKYVSSGQTQVYVLTILVGVGLFSLFISWSMY